MAPGVNKGHDWPIWYNSVHLGPTPEAFWGICLSLQIVPKFVFVFRHVRVQFLCVAFVIGHRCLFTSCDFMEHSRHENRCSVKVTSCGWMIALNSQVRFDSLERRIVTIRSKPGHLCQESIKQINETNVNTSGHTVFHLNYLCGYHGRHHSHA